MTPLLQSQSESNLYKINQGTEDLIDFLLRQLPLNQLTYPGSRWVDANAVDGSIYMFLIVTCDIFEYGHDYHKDQNENILFVE